MKKSNEAFYIVLSDSKGKPIEQTTYDRFNKQVIKDSFNVLVRKMSEEGQEVEYWKENKKYAYISMLVVEFKQGQARLQIIKGNKVYYRKFSYFNK